MGEVKINTERRSSHKMIYLGPWLDALRGKEWELYLCPECGYMQGVQWEPYYEDIDLQLGEGMLTKEEKHEFARLRQVEAGRSERNRRLANQPNHVALKDITESGLRELAKREDRLEDFERAVNQAIVEDKPLLEFTFCGQTVRTWALGTGPVSGGQGD